MRVTKQHCPKHPEQVLICPKCRASEGGKTTAKKHASQLSEWGKLGGRPRKEEPRTAPLWHLLPRQLRERT